MDTHTRSSPRLALAAALAGLVVAGCGERLKEYVSEEGKFRVLLPGAPRTADDPDLPKGAHKIDFVQRSGTYAVAWQDRSGKAATSADERLDQACDAAVERLRGKVLSRKTVTLQGRYPGRELLAEWPGGQGVVLSRLYLVENRLYHVNASGAKWWVESATSRKVVDSFRLLED